MSHAPSNPGPDPIFDQIDAYLDHTLSPSDRGAFEARLAADESLRAELDLARGIEASLKRTHVPADLPAPMLPPQPAARSTLASSHTGRHRLWWLASAAAVLLLASAGYFIYDHFDTSFRRYDPGKFYALAAQRNFAPDWTCNNDEEFKDTTRNNAGQAMLVRQDPSAKVRLIGWAYSKTYRGTPLGPRTIMLFAMVDDAPIIVLVDKLANDAKIKEDSDPRLHIFRRELGNTVLYEITPRPASGVIDAFYLPPEE
ncbi:MAG: hypothetical protein IT434_12485 [Phycisphaerales bacterium]|jgi:hypothetical protein|nr:hypothetical protein [Phycisphaerales bacterium]